MRLPLILLTIVGSTTIATAQHAGDDHATMGHSGHMAASTPPRLSEIVRVLEADQKTDWSSVDLAALREHLVDMDRLVSGARVSQQSLPNGLRMTVTGDGGTLPTLRRMIPAHAAELRRDDRCMVAVEKRGDAVVLTVTSDDQATVARINGLGFFGLMASQEHHRAHHMAIVRGQGHH